MNPMSELQFVWNLTQEISQKTESINALLHAIVCSKRLLADHVDALEQCHAIELEQCYGGSVAKNGRTFTFVKTVVLSSVAAATFRTKSDCLRIVFAIAMATYSTCYLVKSLFICKNILMQNKLNGIIDSIDSIDSAIRRNISYFRESEILTGAETAMDKNREKIMRCLNVIIEMNSLIFNEIKHLESIKLPSRVEEYYESLQELNDCVYFQNEITEAAASDIKNVYNIFLYFQSQFFFRLFLSILNANGNAIQYLKTCHLSELITNNAYELLVALNADKKKVSTDRTVDRLLNANQNNLSSVDLLKAKRSSMDIMSRLVAITNQYEQTDEKIQMFELNSNTKSDDALKLLTQMCSIKKAFSTCEDDNQRLILIFRKLLANKFQIKPEHRSIDGENLKETNDELNDTDEKKMLINIGNEPENMDFFAMRGIHDNYNSDSESMDGENPKLNSYCIEDGFGEFDFKITRSMFAPVLKQLKNKIDPINTEMKERELKFLLATGMDQGTISEFNKDGDTSDAAALDPFAENQKPKQKLNRFDELRSLLQQKRQVLFIQPFLSSSHCDEDILE